MSPAVLWEVWRGGPAVHCFLCAHHCRIQPEEYGLCGVRQNKDGELFTYAFGCAISAAVDPIEKKPLFHFLPGSLSFSVAAVGCNFTCRFCQNSEISQMPRDEGVVRGSALPPEEVVRRARGTGCESVSYTYTEPTIFFEYAYACARRATEEGLKSVFVTNGYMTEQALEMIDGNLHAANIDLKSFSDDYYREIVGARLRPVLHTIERMVEMGVWVELTTLLVPGYNDSEDELRSLASFIAGVDPGIPWHVSRFFPAYKMQDVPPTPVESVERALRIGEEAGLEYVYAGNVRGHDSENTRCPNCGEVAVEREGYLVRRLKLDGGNCRRCGSPVRMVLRGEDAV